MKKVSGTSKRVIESRAYEKYYEQTKVRFANELFMWSSADPFVKYEGAWNWVLPREGSRWISESKGQFTAGTGKFKGIRGTFISKMNGDGSRELEQVWEVEYEIASTNN